MSSSERDLALEILKIKIETALDYGLDIENRVIQLIGDVDENMFAFLDASLTILEAQSRKQITVRINSLGGSTYDGTAIVSRIRASKCKIVTECYGAAMSAASMILACGHKRRIAGLGWVMWHEASYGVDGRHSEIKHIAKQVDREESAWARAMGAFTKRSQEFWASIGAQKDHYFSPEQCLELGIVDEIF